MEIPERFLVVICGPPLSGKSALARRLAEALPGKSALISHDDLLERWIVHHDPDAQQEHQWMYTQTRLLVANFLRNGYSVIVEGAYQFLAHGQVVTDFQEIAGIFGLMASLVAGSQLVVLEAPNDVLRARLASSPTIITADSLQTLAKHYHLPGLQGALRLDSSTLSVDEEADRVLLALGLADPLAR